MGPQIVATGTGSSVVVTGEGSVIEVSGFGASVTVSVTTGSDLSANFSGVHNDLGGRNTIEAHPITAITGLQAALDAKATPAQIATAVSDHVAAVDPHGDRAYTDAEIAALDAAAVGADPAGSAATAQAFSIQRVNHTGVQTIATVTGLQAELDAKAVPGDITTAVNNHVAAVDPHGDRAFSVQRVNHTGTQAISTVVNLQTTLDAKAVPADITSAVSTHVAAVDPHGDRAYTDAEVGALTAADVGADVAGAAAAAQAFSIQRANHTGTQAISTITGLQAELDTLGIDNPLLFAPTFYTALSIAGPPLSAVWSAGDTVLTTTFLTVGGGGPPVPLGRSIIAAGEPIAGRNGAYRALTPDPLNPTFSNGVFTRDPASHQPFTAANHNKAIFSFNPFSATSTVLQIVTGGVEGYTGIQVGVNSPVGVTDGHILTKDTVVGVEFYEWRAPAPPSNIPEPPLFWPPADYSIATKVLRADFAAAGPGFLATDGAWGSAPTSTDITIAGLDTRAMLYLEAPINTGIGASGSFDTYYEVVTQEHPTAGGGDRHESAILWTNSSFGPGTTPGRPYTFYEHLESGGLTETSNWEEAFLDIGRWVCLRWTHDIVNSRVIMWRAVPYRIDATTVTTSDDGITWWPVFDQTFTEAASMDADNTGMWYLGKQATMSIAWLNARTFGNASANLVNATAAGIDALTIGDVSYTDTLGRVWLTVDGQVTASPA